MKKQSWQVTDERFVVFLDIMGFKDMVARNSHQDIYKKLWNLGEAKKSIENTTSQAYSNHLYITQFSDSIILFSKNADESSLLHITSGSLYLMQEAIRNGIALKGAIACGTITVNKERQLYFGQPIIDAYLLEEEVQYYGIVIHNTAEKHFERTHPFVWEDKTYLKSGSIIHKNLMWFKCFDINDINNSIKLAKEHINKIKESVSGSPRKYIDNTLEMCKKYHESINNRK